MQIKISMSKYLLLQDFEIRLCVAENFAFIIYNSKFFKYFNVTIRKIQSFAKCNNMYIHYSNSKMKNACTVHIEILFYG